MVKIKKERIPSVCKKTLLERGWSEKLILLLLGEPDELVRNPVYSSKAKMKVYYLSRVEKAEESEKFSAAQKGRENRKLAAARGVATKTNQAVEAAYYAQVNLGETLPREKLFKKACNAYNDFHWDDEKQADSTSDEEFLHRITVNYLRHEFSDYDAHLDNASGRVGVYVHHDILKHRTLDAIAKAYPWLLKECERQKTPPQVNPTW